MSAAATTELAIPDSRIAGVVDRAIDIAAKADPAGLSRC